MMKNVVMSGLVFGLLVGCVSQTRQRNSAADKSVKVNARLKKFDREHPNCQLWTDWQTMCSRVGKNGEAYCRNDPLHPVKPSEPFCVDEYLGNFRTNMTDKQMESVFRFCEKSLHYDLPESKTGRASRLCTKFSDSRPFSGHNIASLQHPWCREWSDSVTGEKVCRMSKGEHDNTTGVKNCSDATVNTFEHKNLLSCSKLELPKWCADAWTGVVPQDTHPQGIKKNVSKDEIILPVLRVPVPSPVNGLYCLSPKNALSDMEE